MILPSVPSRSSDSCSSAAVTRSRLRELLLSASVVGALVVGCSAEIPFNVNVLPLLPAGTVTGVYEPAAGATDVLPGATAAPEYSIGQLPLNDVQIPFDPGTPVDPAGITSALVEMRIESAFLPASATVNAEMETDVSLYVAPQDVSNRFTSAYRVHLGRATLAGDSVVDLQGELTAEQLEHLGGGGLLLGLEFSGTLVVVQNTGESLYAFQGLSWRLTNLRIRGTVAVSSFGMLGDAQS